MPSFCVWVVTDEDRLARRAFEERWGTAETLYVTSTELVEGERVVTSPLSLPVEGARVRVVDGQRGGGDER